MNELPMRGVLTRQVNVKISETDFKDLEFLRASGVDIGELLRPDIVNKIRKAKEMIEKSLESAS